MSKIYIDNYFRRYKGVQAYIEKTIDEVRKSGRTSTLLDAIRLLPEIGSSNLNVRSLPNERQSTRPSRGVLQI